MEMKMETMSSAAGDKKPVRASEAYCPVAALKYAGVLYELGLPEEAVEKTRETFQEVHVLRDIFTNPTVALDKKQNVIDRVFPEEIRNFLKVLCKYRRMELIGDIFSAYDRYRDERAHVLNAVLSCTVPPTEEQKKRMEAFLCEKYGVKEAHIEICKDDTLMGGFILRAGSDEYDWSLKGRLNRLKLKLT